MLMACFDRKRMHTLKKSSKRTEASGFAVLGGCSFHFLAGGVGGLGVDTGIPSPHCRTIPSEARMIHFPCICQTLP